MRAGAITASPPQSLCKSLHCALSLSLNVASLCRRLCDSRARQTHLTFVMQPPQFVARSVDDFVHLQTPATRAYSKRITGRLFLVTLWDMANLIFALADAAAVVDEKVRWRNLIPDPPCLTAFYHSTRFSAVSALSSLLCADLSCLMKL